MLLSDPLFLKSRMSHSDGTARSGTHTWQDLVNQFKAKAGDLGVAVPLGFFTPQGMIDLPPPPPMAASQGSSASAPSTPGRNGHYEKVPSDIPIEKFPFGKTGADWNEWCKRFEVAVQAATNAKDRDRLFELCVMWVSLKLPEEAQPMYAQCEHKSDWRELKKELADALEDVHTKRKWVRSLSAFKKPSDMTLQVYRSKVIGMVAKHSPSVMTDSTAYAQELYNRFVQGLEVGYREYIEDALPYEKETLDRAYNAALKYEEKLSTKKVDFSGAAMSDTEKNAMEVMRLDVQELKTELMKAKKLSESRHSGRSDRSGRYGCHKSWKDYSQSDYKGRGRKEFRNSPAGAKAEDKSSSGSSGSSSSRSSSSGRDGREKYRAIQTDENSDAEDSELAETITKAVLTGLKAMRVNKKSHKKSKHSEKD